MAEYIFSAWTGIFLVRGGKYFFGRLRDAFLRRGLGGPKIHGSTSRLRRKLAEVRAQPDELWQKRPRRRGIGGSWRTRQHGCPPRAGTMLGLPDVGGGVRSIPPRWCRILTWMSPGGTLLPTRRRSGPPRPWQRRALVARKNTRGGVWGSFGRFWGRRGAPGALGGARGRLGALEGAWERSGALRVLGGRSAAPGSLRPRSGALGGARGRAVARAFPACE